MIYEIDLDEDEMARMLSDDVLTQEVEDRGIIDKYDVLSDLSDEAIVQEFKDRYLNIDMIHDHQDMLWFLRNNENISKIIDLHYHGDIDIYKLFKLK